MNNANKPAYPQDEEMNNQIDKGFWYEGHGLTKREEACIELGIPDTGDEEIDRIIRKAERRKVAMAAMQGILANAMAQDVTKSFLSGLAVSQADALLKELEATDDN